MSKRKKFTLFGGVWGYIRENMILHTHQKVADFWNPVIRAYFDGNIEKYSLIPLKSFTDDKKIIWQYWGQGVDEDTLPEVVRVCFSSVDKNKGEYEVIRLSDETVKDYLDLPSFIWEKLETGQLSRTFFSDLLRLALLHTYGGVWLDATILLSAPPPDRYTDYSYFVYQRDEKEPNRELLDAPKSRYWGWNAGFKVRILNSIIFAKKESEVIGILLDLMLYYWKTEKKARTYYFFQILYNELMGNYLSDKRCPVESDFIPHYLQQKLLDPSTLPTMSIEDILQQGAMHKLTYFKEDVARRFRTLMK